MRASGVAAAGSTRDASSETSNSVPSDSRPGALRILAIDRHHLRSAPGVAADEEQPRGVGGQVIHGIETIGGAHQRDEGAAGRRDPEDLVEAMQVEVISGEQDERAPSEIFERVIDRPHEAASLVEDREFFVVIVVAVQVVLVDEQLRCRVLFGRDEDQLPAGLRHPPDPVEDRRAVEVGGVGGQPAQGLRPQEPLGRAAMRYSLEDGPAVLERLHVRGVVIDDELLQVHLEAVHDPHV